MTPKLATIPLAIRLLRFCALGWGTPGLKEVNRMGVVGGQELIGVSRRTTSGECKRDIRATFPRFMEKLESRAQIEGKSYAIDTI